jgi:hypothetical protein
MTLRPWGKRLSQRLGLQDPATGILRIASDSKVSFRLDERGRRAFAAVETRVFHE